jgi:multiple sugar transport system substrate-binding protein
MFGKKMLAVALFLAAGVLLVACGGGTSAADEQRISELEEQLASAQADLDAAAEEGVDETQIAELEQALADAQSALEQEQEEEPAAEEEPAELPEGGIKVIPFITTETDPETVAVFQEVIAEYEEQHPDVIIDLVLTAHGSEEQRLITASAVGAELGIIGVHPDYLVEYVEAGYLLPLDSAIENIGRDNFKRAAVLNLQGHDYAVGYAAGTHATLWVRRDLFEAAGLELPTTYDELLAAAEALTQDTDGDGNIDIYGIGIPAAADGATEARFVSFVYQNCGDWFDKQGNLVFDNPNVLDALNKYVELLQYAPPDVTGWSWYDGITAYTAGKIAMHPYGGRLGYNLFRDNPELRENTTVIWMPVGDEVHAGRGGYDYLAVSANARWPEETLDFLEFFLTGDRLARFDLTVPGHLIPPTYDLDQVILESDDPYVQAYSADIETLFDSINYTALPGLQMGAVDVDTCTFDPVYNPMPWGGTVTGNYIASQMIERVAVGGESPEAAWEWAYTEMQNAADEWKAEHPDWEPIAE